MSRRLMLLALVLLGVLGCGAVAAAQYPNCGFNCTAGDVTVDGARVEVPGNTCVLGEDVTVSIYATFNNSTKATRYAVRVVGDLYVNGMGVTSLDACVAESIPPGKHEYLLTTETIACSARVEFRFIVVSWSASAESCADTPTCAARKAKCWQPSGGTIVVQIPALVVGFTSGSPACLGGAVRFTNTTTGGKTPYQYQWQFGDGTTSADPSPSHTYAASGDYPVSLTVRDAAGVTSTALQDVVVLEPPLAMADNGGPYCPGQTIALYADGGVSYKWTGPAGFASTLQNPTIPRAAAANAGTYTVTVTDAFSCTSQASTVVSLDATPPTLSVPADATVECDDAYDPSVAGEATAFDNEDPAPTVTYADLITSGSCGGAKRVQRTWTATDECGNRSTALQTIALIDTTPPSLEISDVTFECDGAGNASDIAAWLASAKTADACGSVMVTNDFDGLSARCSGTGTATVTFTATDGCGNVTEEVATLKIVDSVAPDAVDDPSATPEDSPVLIDVLGNDSDRCLGDLTIVSVTPPTFGDATVVGDAIEYTPSADASGTAEFRYTIEDCAGHRDVALVRVTVTPVNDAPAAVDQAATLNEDTSAALKLTGADVDRDALTFAIESGPQNGTLTGLNPTTGAVTYTPDQDYNGPDSFTFTVCDPSGSCDEGTVTLSIRPVNDAPTAVDQAAALSEDEPLLVKLTGTDVDGDALTYAIVAGPTYGTLAGFSPATGAVTYTPNLNYNGSDSFTFTVCDPSGACDTGTIDLSISPVNDPPVADDQSATLPEDGAVTLQLMGTDVDGDALTFSVASPPMYGLLVGFDPSSGAVTYVPDPNYHGADSFLFTVCGPTGACDTGTVLLSIGPVNDTPSAFDQSGSLSEDEPLALQLMATDVDGDALLFTIGTPPAHGTLVGFDPATGAVVYLPGANYNGPDTFIFTACDPSGACDTATVTLTVAPVGDAPTAIDQAGMLDEDEVLSLRLEGTSADSGALTYAVSTGPAHGTLVGLNPETGAVTYVPDADYHGTDSFVFIVCTAAALCDTGTVTLTIGPVNDSPTAVDTSLSISEDSLLAVHLIGADADGDVLTISIAAGPTNGTLVGFDPATGTATYVPDRDYNGADSFTFTVCDPPGACDTGTITLVITPVNDAPAAADQTGTLAEDGSLDLVLSATDADGDVLTYSMAGGPAHGTLVGFDPATGTVTYVPDPNYNGSDSFTFTVCGPTGACDTATVTLTVNAVNDGPTAVDRTETLSEDGSISGQFEGMDPDGDALTFTIVTWPLHGTVTIVDPATATGTYVPYPNYNGTDTFTFAACDPTGACDIGTITLLVTPVNDPPAAIGTAGTLNEDTSLALQLEGTDPDGDVLTFAITTGPAHGTVIGFDSASGAVTYVPDPNYYGPDSFSFTVCGPTGACDTGTVTLAVAPVNDPPVTAAQDVWTREDTNLSIQLAGSDVDGDALTFAILSAPTHGTLVGFNPATGGLTYVPEPNYSGLDALTFTVCDAAGACSQATVTIDVVEVNDPPAASDMLWTTFEDEPTGFLPLEIADPDDALADLVYTNLQMPLHGTLEWGPNHTLQYTPDPDWFGTDSFSYEVCDPSGACDTARITILVRARNDAPSANDDSLTVSGTEPNSVTLTGSDPDSDALVYRLLSLPEHGTIVDFGEATGVLTYVADPGYAGADAFTFEVCDTSGACDTATIDLLVVATAHAPVAEPQDVSTFEGTPLEIVLRATDVDGDSITYSILSLPGHGSIEGFDAATGELIYVPARGFDGEDLFAFKACDPFGACAVSLVTVSVLPVNNPPDAVSRETTVTAGIEVDIPLTARDPDGDSVTFSIVQPPSHGAIVEFDSATGVLVLLPDEGYAGPDMVIFRACDPSGACADGIIQTFAVLTAGGGGAIGACERRVVISEVGWAGTAADSDDEWIELRNVEDSEVDLAGWTLRWRPLVPSSALDGFWRAIGLSGTVGAFSGSSRASLVAAGDGWFRADVRVEPTSDVVLLERAADHAVSDVVAAQVYADTLALGRRLDLPDAGGVMELVDPYGCIVDRVGQVGQVEGWPAGNAALPASMQRDERLLEVADAEWSTNWGLFAFGHDKSGGLILGTPGTVNPPPMGEILPLLSAEGARAIPIGAVLAVALPGDPNAWTTGPAMVRLTDRVRGELAIPASGLLVETSGVGGAATVIVGTSDLPAGGYALWVRSAAGIVYTVLVTVLP